VASVGNATGAIRHCARRVITAVLGAPVAPEDVRHVQKAHEERRSSLALLVQGKSGVRWVSMSISLTGS
jgi:hypothetical protein